MGLSGNAAPNPLHTDPDPSTAALDSNKAPLLENLPSDQSFPSCRAPLQLLHLRDFSKENILSLSWQSACQIQREEGISYQDSKRA